MDWLRAQTIEISHIAVQFKKQIRRLKFRFKFKTIKNQILKDKNMFYRLKERSLEPVLQF
jgi:hypothetical protein